MDETTIGVAAILAPIIPFAVSALKRASLPAAFNMALTVCAALALAAFGLVIAGEIDLQNGIQEPEAFLAAAGLAFAESQWIYRLLIKGTVRGERLNNVLTTWPARPTTSADPNTAYPTEALPLGENAPDPGPPKSGPGANPAEQPDTENLAAGADLDQPMRVMTAEERVEAGLPPESPSAGPIEPSEAFIDAGLNEELLPDPTDTADPPAGDTATSEPRHAPPRRSPGDPRNR